MWHNDESNDDGHEVGCNISGWRFGKHLLQAFHLADSTWLVFMFGFINGLVSLTISH